MKKAKKKGGRKRDKLLTIILVIVFVVGLGVMLYPTVSELWNSRVQSRVVAVYDEAVAALSEADYTAEFEAAYAYNERLAGIGTLAAMADTDLVDEDYWDLLNVTGDGVMGYVTIDKIDVRLPIYHGTESSSLAVGAGHLEGTSLPVGGESTHSVISAHRGLPSALLFTNLDEMEIGDTFTVTILDQVLTYQVDQITVVLPDELENLYIEEGQDYCTLMTCTPYGINTHRMLVRGVRIETEETTHLRVTAEARRISGIMLAAAAIAIMLIILLIVLFVSARGKSHI